MDCEEYHRVAFTRSPQPLTFEASSGIFVGNAGGTGLPRFVVSLDGGRGGPDVLLHAINKLPRLCYMFIMPRGGLICLSAPQLRSCIINSSLLMSAALVRWADKWTSNPLLLGRKQTWHLVRLPVLHSRGERASSPGSFTTGHETRSEWPHVFLRALLCPARSHKRV